MMGDGFCTLALDEYSDNASALVTDGGAIVDVKPTSLAAWAIKLDPRNPVRKEVITGLAGKGIDVYAQTENSWLTRFDLGKDRPPIWRLISKNGQDIEIEVRNPARVGTPARAWDIPLASPDAVLSAALALAERAQVGKSKPILDDLGSVNDGRRALVIAGSTVHLLSTEKQDGKVCFRQAELPTIAAAWPTAPPRFGREMRRMTNRHT